MLTVLNWDYNRGAGGGEGGSYNPIKGKGLELRVIDPSRCFHAGSSRNS